MYEINYTLRNTSHDKKTYSCIVASKNAFQLENIYRKANQTKSRKKNGKRSEQIIKLQKPRVKAGMSVKYPSH